MPVEARPCPALLLRAEFVSLMDFEDLQFESLTDFEDLLVSLTDCEDLQFVSLITSRTCSSCL